jgi:hypothetical protein
MLTRKPKENSSFLRARGFISHLTRCLRAHGRHTSTMILFMLVLCVGCILVAGHVLADDDGKEKSTRHEMREHDGDHEELKVRAAALVDADDDGNEITGQMAAWLWAGANLTVVLSILIKSVNRYVPLKQAVKSAFSRFNAHQKKYLMWSHYYLNPLILCVALVHWLLSRCPSTQLPEWGLLIMSILTLSGIAVKFKLLPVTLKARVYKWHKQPLFFLALIAVLVFGHSIAD